MQARLLAPVSAAAELIAAPRAAAIHEPLAPRRGGGWIIERGTHPELLARGGA